MNNNRMRRVKVFSSTWKTIDGKRLLSREEIGEGVFHEWGIDLNMAGSYSVAIVEADDGRVFKYGPENIQFISDEGDDDDLQHR